MLENLDPVLLSRIQFAFTISFHIVFPAFTIGLASWLAVLEWRWLRTGDTVYADVYRLWVRIFAVAFGMGVVSGVVMSFEFGTNWSVFSDRVANVLGPLLGYEVLLAFFLEASFLGVMLFGWDRVKPGTHFASTLIVALGTLFSAFWILSANSWMQTPSGFRVGENGIFFPTDWFQVIFNPSFPYRFAHMVTAAYLTTAFVAGGIGAFYLSRGRHPAQARVMLGMAMIMAVLVAPMQLLLGDLHGLNTVKRQPAKIAAIESLWETRRNAPLVLLGWPSQDEETNHYSIEIPGLSSLILTHDRNGEVKGLKAWPKDERPPVLPVFWSFRVMVGIGILMSLTGIMSLVLFLRKKLFETRWFQYWCMAMTPAGFIAVLAGWFVTEMGRQPYIVQGLMRTAEAASPVRGASVALSISAFVLAYSVIFGAGIYYIAKLIAKGPGAEPGIYGEHGLRQPPLITELASEEGEKHV